MEIFTRVMSVMMLPDGENAQVTCTSPEGSLSLGFRVDLASAPQVGETFKVTLFKQVSLGQRIGEVDS